MVADAVPGEDDVSSTHPQYDERVAEWSVMRDTARGSSAVTRGLGTYLPMPDGFQAQLDRGASMYAAYAMRAQFPEIVGPTVVGMVGTVCRIDAKIELPAGLEYLRENVDGQGTTLTNLYRKVVEEVVTSGGRVLLADSPVGGGDPCVVSYATEALINWSEDRDFFVLSETSLKRDNFRWRVVPAWRVLRHDGADYTVELYDEDKRLTAVAPDAADAETSVVVRAAGDKAVDAIPLVRIGARDLDLEPDNPPLLGVARAALAIYRLDADYRHQLFMSGQETLFGKGIDPAKRPETVGAGVAFFAENPQAELKYVGPSCKGIEAHERAIAAERTNAAALGARVFDTGEKAGVESGDALRIRRGATVATLVTIGQTVGEGVETVLRHAARLKGEDPEAVVVTPNLSYVDATMTPKDALALVQTWQSGAISYETMYANLQRGEIATYERSAEEERDMINSEAPADPGGGTIGSKMALKPDFGESGAAPPVPTAGDRTLPADPTENEPPSDSDLSTMFDPELLKG